MTDTNWFDRGGADYARFRPRYPPELAQYVTAAAARHDLALDVGCGSGQFTTLLAPGFALTLGCDPSASQLAAAERAAGVHYVRAAAEHLPLRARRADLITVAQAAHWLDLPAFYAEARRVARPGAVLALVTYGTLHFAHDALERRFQRFYAGELGPWWPPERRLVDAAYRTLPFPFEERAAPAMEIRVHWPLAAFLGYLSTWSAVRRARAGGQGVVLQRFVDDLHRAWGAPETARTLTWPLHLRLGQIA